MNFLLFGGMVWLVQVNDDLGERFCCTDHRGRVNRIWPRLLQQKLILRSSGGFIGFQMFKLDYGCVWVMFCKIDFGVMRFGCFCVKSKLPAKLCVCLVSSWIFHNHVEIPPVNVILD